MHRRGHNSVKYSTDGKKGSNKPKVSESTAQKIYNEKRSLEQTVITGRSKKLT